MNRPKESVRTIDLGYEQLLVFQGRRGQRVRVLYGATWLTQEGEADDAVLRAGAEQALHGGRAVIEGLAPARLQLIEPAARGATARLSSALLQAWRGARRQVTRLQLGAAAVEPCA